MSSMRSLENRFKNIPILSILIPFGTFGAVIWHFGYLGEASYPWSTYLFRPDDRFMDFKHFWEQCTSLNPYLSVPATETRPYLPFAYIVNLIFMLPSWRASMVLYFAFFTAVTLVLCFQLLGQRGFTHLFPLFALAFLTSYPFIFVVDRGNPEISILPLILLFIAFYQKEKKSWISSSALAIAISMKITPALFLLLHIRDRRWKDMFFVSSLCVVLTVSSLLFLTYLNPGTGMWEHAERMLENQKLFTNHYGLTTEGLVYAHSMFGFVKFLLLTGAERTNDAVALAAGSYSAIVFLATFVIGAWLLFKKASREEFFTSIVLMMLLFPHMSGDYKLLNLFMPILFCFEVSLRSNWVRILQVICLGLLVVPKAYIRSPVLPEISSNAVISPILLLAALLLVLSTGRKSST